jgi:hypothetical protein
MFLALCPAEIDRRRGARTYAFPRKITYRFPGSGRNHFFRRPRVPSATGTSAMGSGAGPCTSDHRTGVRLLLRLVPLQ